MKNLHNLLSVSASSFKLKTNDKRVLNTLSEMLTANREKSVLGKLALFTVYRLFTSLEFEQDLNCEHP